MVAVCMVFIDEGQQGNIDADEILAVGRIHYPPLSAETNSVVWGDDQ
jgi:hypothetical protein